MLKQADSLWNFDDPLGEPRTYINRVLSNWEQIQLGCFYTEGEEIWGEIDNAKLKWHQYLRERIGGEFNRMLASLTNTPRNNQFIGWKAAWYMNDFVKDQNMTTKEFCDKMITFLNDKDRYKEKFNADLSSAGYPTDGSNNQIANSSTSQNPDPQIEKAREDARNMDLEIEAAWGEDIKLSAFSDDEDLYLNSVMMETMKSKYNIYSDQQIRSLNLIYDACNIIRKGDRFKSRDEKKPSNSGKNCIKI